MNVAQHALTLEQFLELPETEPPSEFQGGTITQKPLPKGKHSRLQAEWTARLNHHGNPRRLGAAFPELRCTFAGVSFVPDVAYFSWPRIARDASGSVADDFTVCPDVCIEVLSPGQSSRRLEQKLELCVRSGCRMGLLIDPYGETVKVYRPECAVESIAKGPLGLSSVVDGFHVTVEEIFGWLRIE